MAMDRSKRQTRWYFGGLASAGAACCTHPLDLIKVHLQVQQTKEFGMVGMGIRVFKNDGIMGLYNGISASILRQLTYSMTRFAVYEVVKNTMADRSRDASGKAPPLTFLQKAALAGISGFAGGIVGNPADLVNVRMQNDMKLPAAQRRNYKHAINGMYRVCREERVMALFNGVSMTAVRGGFMTIGQVAFYDQIKQVLLTNAVTKQYFKDNPVTHFSASITAAICATIITQPFDVMKTRLQKAKPGEYSGLLAVGVEIFKTGPLGFFKGLVPAGIRLAPHTVLTFVFLEQLRLNFGYFPTPAGGAAAAKPKS